MVRLLLLLALISPFSCRNKEDSATDTGTVIVDTDDTAGLDLDQDGYPASTDCDDTDETVNPGADEVAYDGVDNDCDETTPDDDLDGDGVLGADDCDDENSDVYPGAVEVCNDLDDDCNDEIDDAVGDTWFADDDDDGYGDPDLTTQDCDGATGYVADATDCDDTDPEVHPDAAEVCDGIDNDCDLLADDEDPDVSDAAEWFGDLDGDGWGDPANTVTACEGPSQFVLVADDCDDTDPEVHPDAEEVCNDLDDDCDGLVDDEDDDLLDPLTWYGDDDGDGYGVPDDTVDACEAPSGYADNPDDCNDDEATAFPGANEVCNDIDDDCDGDVDEADATDAGKWYLDDDGDGYGDATVSVPSCDGATGYVADDTDCDDTDGAVNPGATEVCNGLDDDCDTLVDDDDPDVDDQEVWYWDVDGDGYGDPSATTIACELPSGASDDDTDCDDGDAEVHPDAEELCNELDDDCDTLVDDDDPDVSDAATWYLDFDGDGFGNSTFTLEACVAPSGYVANDQDCEDAYASANPLGTETCDNLDNDCDGTVDEGATDATTWYSDADGDGYGDASTAVVDCTAPSDGVEDATDCDDSDAAVNPGEDEVCNGVDDDCDSAVDDDDPDLDTTTASTWFEDADGDGYGDPDASQVSCEAPTDHVADDSDCDDGDAAINPGAVEVCNGLDDDCDGDTDDDDSSLDDATATTWYDDDDGDGYGDAGDATVACEAPSSTVSDNTDCDDGAASVNPGAVEVCNGTDDDCDGDIDDEDSDLFGASTSTWYDDDDGDGYGDPDAATDACDQPSGTVTDATDCDDTDAALNPDTTWYADSDGDGYGDPDTTTIACEAPDASWLLAAGDCDDSDATANAGGTEVCGGGDEDCDGLTDDDDPGLDTSTATTWYDDDDGDGYGDAGDSTVACDAPSGTVADNTDCDDGDSAVSPAAVEVCNGTDDDCDGDIDDEDASLFGASTSTWYDDDDGDGYGDPDAATQACDQPSGTVTDATDCDDTDATLNPDTTWYADSDGDGYGDPDSTSVACESPSGTWLLTAGDCDDSDATASPGGTEVCGGGDEDCDGLTDDDDPSVSDSDIWYIDYDGDGYGDASYVIAACLQPSGYVSNTDDCDDTDAAVSPVGTEACNGYDDDCDGLVDDEDSDFSANTTWYADTDGDGFGDPGALTESCEAPTDHVADATDCDDDDAAVNPDATEVCNGTDDDCDGDIDDDDSDVDLSTASDWYADDDGDSYGDPADSVVACDASAGRLADATDCDDTDGAVNPAATEVCNDVDDDCNGDIDDDDAGLDTSTASTWYADDDGDSYGDAADSLVACDAPTGRLADATDCDDTDSAVNPAASEVCNDVDDDCDGDTDDADAGLDTSTASTWYADDDGDSYGDPDDSQVACDQPSATVTDATDCDDGDSAVHPGATEVCNSGVDDDCNGSADDSDSGLDTSTATTWYADADGDGYGSSTSTLSCEAPSGYGSGSGDCDDSNSSVNPGAAEVCANGTDEDCDGSYSEGCSTQTLACGGPSAMDPGQSHSCSIGSTVVVTGFYISVGCNDGETGSYTVSMSDGYSTTVTGSCGSTHSVSDRLVSSGSIYMNSGGGGDNHISFTCCGSSGWGFYYK